ncbi:MAG: hypothetical protein E5Y88_25435 [Mesorhizobium sp.]|uniref:Uncharacterized protein n=1 Tax=Mesorhizobium mediterraneum TaxID=43617 RepID=A0AB36R261_9HYPH|nr:MULTISPECIES: hypothetical protein [Mesorhizobium]RUU28048.1 hypothetical protein EOD08_21670 [Mesorhizobium sp. M6A.T.Ca.TU.002.02.2.1]AZO66515.1 hypothetical protein EJ075_17435 [Mesorhizobium sp. M6A.T.Cr.TU.016.01.1.1]PAP98860.1 hypothetical protein CIT25_28140 [Mesorhizobium mediterraneum]RUU33252.1 hypothetical protein EOC93_29285 [Mesorhizobium sp. M6A.T.Ce.TU.002.03.1.1]RUV02236.1 hypothetical protein EOB36_10640 [Mesorhizobium sp. M6A.T.Cr.TU.017.01.1.1]
MMAEMAVAMPLMLAGEQGLFHFPSPDEVRVQPISRAENEAEWPFAVDDGVLACVWSGGQRIVSFFEGRPSDLDEDEPFEPRGLIVTTDPIQLTIGNMANRALFRPAASIEERIRLVAPFVTLGQRLCDQPAGARVGHGEL